MRILFLTHSFNSLTQRLFVELSERGHEVTLEFDINDAVTLEAVRLAEPDLILAPYLRRALPELVWRERVCLILHPGPEGDRGPTALDWAILDGASEWGVTVLQAQAELDAGPVWASATFPMRETTKGSLYRNEVTEAAVTAVLNALEQFPEGPCHRPAHGYWRPAVTQQDRAIDWLQDNTTIVLRKIRSADGAPGVLGSLFGEPVYFYDACPATGLSGEPGEVIARGPKALCRATADGAVWIGHLRRQQGDRPLKLPATRSPGEALHAVPEQAGADDVWYEERHEVGYLHFPFYNGAMSADQCERLRQQYLAATRRDTRVIVLMGGPDFWSNGLHLNVIEAAESPADESWRNINAMNDLCREIVVTGSHLTISALQGNAGAGGVFLALAADWVIVRSGVVLNPHYKSIGNLHGSEYWTYLLPRRAGAEKALEVTQARLPMGVAEAKRLRLIDDHFDGAPAEFRHKIAAFAEQLAASADLPALLAEKRRRRSADEAEKPLERYRAEELERMKLNFYGFDTSYHVARYNFVHKVPKSRTPLYLARHRHKPRPAGFSGKV